MEKITQETLDTFNYIKQLKKASKEDVLCMQQFTQKYIDHKCTVCPTCPAQIRFAYNRIINWGAKMEIETISFEETLPIQTKLCECGNPTKDNRNKRCEDCKNK